MSGTKTGWTTQDGTSIYAKYWAPEGPAKALVCLVHGLGEHCERYEHVAEMLNANGMALYGFDHRGHGRSGGQRGFIPSYEVLMEEVDLLLQHGREQFPDVPVFLYGHSWGGNAAGNYLIRRQPDVQGAIITSPWFRLTHPPSGFLVALARVMNAIWPSMSQSNGLDPNHISHNPDEVKAYKEDPLVHGKITPRLYIETAEAGEYAIANAAKVQVPLLLIHGSDDQITAPEGTKAFHANVTARKVLKIFDGMYHETHNEVEKDLVLAEMLKFYQDHL